MVRIKPPTRKTDAWGTPRLLTFRCITTVAYYHRRGRGKKKSGSAPPDRGRKPAPFTKKVKSAAPENATLTQRLCHLPFDFVVPSFCPLTGSMTSAGIQTPTRKADAW